MSEPGAAPPPRFLAHVRVRFHDVDALGHVNNAAYLTYLEQAAIDHATLAGFDLARMRELGGLFIARRHELDFLKPAFERDVLQIETWIDEARGARAIRRYEARRIGEGGRDALPPDRLLAADEPAPAGEPIVSARTEWVYVDPTGRPRRMPAELMAWFRPA
ncbi:MAG TPA: thioesterase family protein [Thermomicrobiales bacterium]|nr:thioesterase family protein [Thermomicrobiales bacterium]